MGNPAEGQDYTVNMTVPDTISLVGATVTIEYIKPDKSFTEGVTPTNVDTTNNIISYKIEDTDSVAGLWEIGAKIIESSGDVSFINPKVLVRFDRRSV